MNKEKIIGNIGIHYKANRKFGKNCQKINKNRIKKYMY